MTDIPAPWRVEQFSTSTGKTLFDLVASNGNPVIVGPVPKTYHRAQVARMLERAEYIRATPKGTGIPTRYGLAIDTGSETFFVETRA